MKTILTVLVALVLNYSASANHLHGGHCTVNCPESKSVTAPASKNYEQKLIEVKLASEDKLSRLNYNQTMQRALSIIAKQKHLNAIANLEAENTFTHLMVNTLSKVEEQKVAEQIEDLAAQQRFESLMGYIFYSTVTVF